MSNKVTNIESITAPTMLQAQRNPDGTHTARVFAHKSIGRGYINLSHYREHADLGLITIHTVSEPNEFNSVTINYTIN